MAILKKETVSRYKATYLANKKFQGRTPTFTHTFDNKPPKTIKGDNGITYKRVGSPKKVKVQVRRIGRYVFG